MIEPNLRRVALARGKPSYPEEFPFDPAEAYPEYQGSVSPRPNTAYEAVRRCLFDLGLDRERFGTPAWNPLAGLIRPGQRVFIKPNWVTHEYRVGCGCEGDLFSVITHTSVLRAIADYAALALQGEGELVIGDNPCIDADFELLMARTQARELEGFYASRGVTCRVLDLRPRVTRDLTHYGIRSHTEQQRGDPEGERVLNLGKDSFFRGMNPLLFRGVFTNRWETIRHHHGERHEYSLSRTIWNSDVYISVPKLKSHHKVGATLNIKGLVGVNYNKNYLVHWRVGFPALGGDEFPTHHRRGDVSRLALRHLMRDLLPEAWYVTLRSKLKGSWLDRQLTHERRTEHERYRGAWDGNDTCWRMAADLYRAFIRDATGTRGREGRSLATFSVVDGIVGGEHNGPFCPRRKACGVVLAGQDLLSVDSVAARLMDFDLRGVAYLRELVALEQLQLDEIEVVETGAAICDFFRPDRKHLGFEAPEGWPELSLRGLGSRPRDRDSRPTNTNHIKAKSARA